MRSGWFYSLIRMSAGVFLSCSLLLFASTASAQVHASFAVAGTKNAAVNTATSFTDPACPPYGGVLSAISVAVNGSVDLYIEIGAAQPTDLVYTLSSAKPAYVVAGNQAGGFLPQVTIPAGSLVSNAFTIYGVTVGATTIDASLAGYGVVLSVPVTAWGITNTTGSTQLLDANTPSPSCIDAGTSMEIGRAHV